MLQLAERKGFEPLDAFTSLVFETSSFDHSDTSPLALIISLQHIFSKLNILILFSLINFAISFCYLVKIYYNIHIEISIFGDII